MFHTLTFKGMNVILRIEQKAVSRVCSGDGQQHSPEEIPGNL